MTTSFEPLHLAPRGLRPPYTQGDPDRAKLRHERTECWRQRMHADQLGALLDPLKGIDLGSYDRAVLDWLAGWDIPTVATIASLLHRTRQAGRADQEGAGA